MYPRIDKGPIEYTLEIGKTYNRDQQRDCLRFRFRTVEDFLHFQYRLAIEERHGNNSLEFALRGLKTRGLTLPAAGKAEGDVDVFDLEGTYSITIIKPGNIKNSFSISVAGNHPSLVKGVEEENPFIELKLHE